MPQGKVLIFSAPSGAGKTTIVRYLIHELECLTFSISATTRSKRPHEIDGKDYYFLQKEDFLNRIKSGEFVEYEEVYQGTYYGTLKTEINRIHAEGKTVILDVDVQGAVHLKAFFGEKALAVFVKPPSIEALADRLRKRNTESGDKLEERIKKARYELSFESRFDAIVLNDDLEQAKTSAKETVITFLEKA